MNKPYIYESSKNPEFVSNKAIIVLPDIYCQTNYSKKTVDDFALNFKRPVFLLDYFSISTREANNFNEGDREKVHNLMTNFKGDKFVTFLKKSFN